MTFSDFLLHACLRADILQTALVTVRLRPRRTDFTPVIHQAVAEIAAFLRWNQLPECHFHALRVLDSFHQPYPVYQADAVRIRDNRRFSKHIPHNEVGALSADSRKL